MENKLIGQLAKIQKELKVPKSQTNTFGNYKYRNCEDILEAVKSLLPEGVVLVLGDKIVQVGERYYVRATAKLLSGEFEISNVAYAREVETRKGMDESQITGATSSYARKYALNGLFGIDDTKDADSQNNTKGSNGAETSPKPATGANRGVEMVSKEQIITITELFSLMGVDDTQQKATLQSVCKTDDVDKLTYKKATSFIKALEKRRGEIQRSKAKQEIPVIEHD